MYYRGRGDENLGGTLGEFMSGHSEFGVVAEMGLLTNFALDFFEHCAAGQAFGSNFAGESESGEGLGFPFRWAWVADEFHTAHFGQRGDFRCIDLLGLFAA